ncbi:MAG: hypothetical protein LBR95_03985 [Azoarcus sp.]|jgi:hypothetical protein|nr:hypothetical protein [Azoarcus sp.]
MSTRATIRFTERGGSHPFYVYLHSDGNPACVLPDIQKTVEKAESILLSVDSGIMTTLFLTMQDTERFDKGRAPVYVITPCFHGDESYRYFVEVTDDGKIEFGIIRERMG